MYGGMMRVSWPSTRATFTVRACAFWVVGNYGDARKRQRAIFVGGLQLEFLVTLDLCLLLSTGSVTQSAACSQTWSEKAEIPSSGENTTRFHAANGYS